MSLASTFMTNHRCGCLSDGARSWLVLACAVSAQNKVNLDLLRRESTTAQPRDREGSWRQHEAVRENQQTDRQERGKRRSQLC